VARVHRAATASGQGAIVVNLLYKIDHVGEGVRVRLTGELDLSTVGRLHDVLTAANNQPDTTGVVVDLHEVTYIDSTSIGALIAGLKTAHQAGRSFHVSGVHGMVQDVLAVTGVLEPLTA
jgi:anti-sigma B factor antagonist